MDDEALASVPFFSALSPAARRAVAPYAEQIELAAGTQLTEEGERGYLFFVIKSGTAKVFQDDREIRDLGDGDFFGEIALLATSERTASVIASTPMQLVVLTESRSSAWWRRTPLRRVSARRRCASAGPRPAPEQRRRADAGRFGYRRLLR